MMNSDSAPVLSEAERLEGEEDLAKVVLFIYFRQQIYFKFYFVCFRRKKKSKR